MTCKNPMNSNFSIINEVLLEHNQTDCLVLSVASVGRDCAACEA